MLVLVMELLLLLLPAVRASSAELKRFCTYLKPVDGGGLPGWDGGGGVLGGELDGVRVQDCTGLTGCLHALFCVAANAKIYSQ